MLHHFNVTITMSLQKYGPALCTIGKGVFGIVTKHTHSNKVFALKTIAEPDWCFREKEICEFLSVHNHENVVNIIEVLTTNQLVIVMEYISKTLHDILMRMNSMNQRLKQHCAVKILSGVASGIAFLHAYGLIHRDLKPQNILVHLNSYTAKICDFGSCKFLEAINTTYICTRYYRAPEQILDCNYGFSADMWSFGCISCEITIGLPFFIGESNTSQLCEIIKKIGMISPEDFQKLRMDIQLPPIKVKKRNLHDLLVVYCHGKAINVSYGTAYEDLLSKLLKWAPADRITAKEVLQHIFFT